MLSTRIVATVVLFALVALIARARYREIKPMREARKEAALIYTLKDERTWPPLGPRELKTQWRRTLTPEVFRFHRIQHLASPVTGSYEVWRFKFRYRSSTDLSFYQYTLGGHPFMSGYGNLLDCFGEGVPFWEFREEVDGEWRVGNPNRQNGGINMTFMTAAGDGHGWRRLKRDHDYNLSLDLGLIDPGSRVCVGLFTKAGVFWSEPFVVPDPRSVILDYQPDVPDNDEK